MRLKGKVALITDGSRGIGAGNRTPAVRRRSRRGNYVFLVKNSGF